MIEIVGVTLAVLTFAGGIGALIWKGGGWFQKMRDDIHENTRETRAGFERINSTLGEHESRGSDHERRITVLETKIP